MQACTTPNGASLAFQDCELLAGNVDSTTAPAGAVAASTGALSGSVIDQLTDVDVTYLATACV